MIRRSIAWMGCALAAAAQTAVVGQSGSEGGGVEYVMDEALVVPRPVTPGEHPKRSPIHVDYLEAEIVSGSWRGPEAGTLIEVPGGEGFRWEEAEAGPNGWVRHEALGDGYAYWSVDSPDERVMILDASGHSMAYVNGSLRAGDVYKTGWVRLPVLVRQGMNEFVFRVGRGSVRAKLVEPRGEVWFARRDMTLADLVEGEDWAVRGGIIIVNATREAQRGLVIETGGSGLGTRRTEVPAIGPLTIRKVPFWYGGAVEPGVRECGVKVELVRRDEGVERVIDQTSIRVRVRKADEKHKRTFVSEIDGSVQYYAVTPMRRTDDMPVQTDDGPALFLTLHGAGVEAEGQGRVYGYKGWGHVVAPTNRRPYGFDWEDWGRWDAMEVMELNVRRLGIDPGRVYLTGHSMGGHGTWQVGATWPDRFAAIGPSAGWVSFWSYAGAKKYGEASALERIMKRASSSSDTLALARNYKHYGIYILHGEKDDNVPAAQARIMMDALEGFHQDYTYHEEPGAGHWWGSRCCDWPPMFEFFAQRRRPSDEAIDVIEFHTANPGISAWSHWVGIEQQLEHLSISSVRAALDRPARRFEVETENVGRLALRVGHLADPGPIVVAIDGQRFEAIAWPERARRIWLVRESGEASWRLTDVPLDGREKGPHRYGPFKEAFRHRMVFVYGTQGTEEENAWAYSKARYDAETFWYRGNGSVDVVADVDEVGWMGRDRGVILYGNGESNAAWEELLGDSPVQVERGVMRVGERELRGEDVGCVLVRPRRDSDFACVGVVTGTGVVGMRLTDRLPYFLAGVGYPDLLAVGPEVLEEGTAGIRAAGFFGRDWSVEKGQWAWPGE